MTGGVLMVVVPWLLFACTVATIGVLAARRKAEPARGWAGGWRAVHPSAGKRDNYQQAAEEVQQAAPGGPATYRRQCPYGRPGPDDGPGPRSAAGPASEPE